MDIDLPDEYRLLGASYDAFDALLTWPDETLYHVQADVSGWSPAQHLYHILVANGMMLKGIAMICRGDERVLPQGALNAAGRYTLSRQRFSRGKARAPEVVWPPDEVPREALQRVLARSRQRYAATAPVLPAIPDARGWISHVYLGELTASEWLRLTRLHSEHHLTIIREIAEANTAA